MTMVLPLIVLAVLSVVGGLIGFPHASWIGHWLDPVIKHEHELREGISASTEWVLMGLSTVVAITVVLLSLRFYSDLKAAKEAGRKFTGIRKFLENKWYVDEVYEAIVIRPIYVLSQGLWKGFDIAVIDRIVLGFGKVTERAGQSVRVLQTGSIQVYAFLILSGLLATVGYMIYGLAK
jgi:NADH-quinone oxidoreductase subunit L